MTEAELAALWDKEASLKEELKEVLAAKMEKPEADMRGKDGDSPQENRAEVSDEEAEEKCKTHGEMKRLYPMRRHGVLATCTCKMIYC